MAAQAQRAGGVLPRRKQNGASTNGGAGLDRFLNGRASIVGLLPGRPIIPDIEDGRLRR
jgi:hypothetical protein